MNDNWNRIIFTDETAFDLFRNKVSRWHKNGKRPIRRLLKSCQKVMTWGGISKKGKTPCFVLPILWMGHFMLVYCRHSFYLLHKACIGEIGVCNKIMIQSTHHVLLSSLLLKIQLIQLIGHSTAQISTLLKTCGQS